MLARVARPCHDREMDDPAATRPATHILSTSGTMLGVTTTLIGLVKLLETQTQASRVDELAGGVLLLFLVAAVTSYSSIRTELRPAMSRRLERVADVLFVLGIVSLATVGLIFAWEVL